MQHPEAFGLSAKGLAAHLGDLCAILEHGASMATGLELLNHGLNGALALERPPLPSHRGDVTLGDVENADAALWPDELQRWGTAVWAAYGDLQPWARKLLTDLSR
ncbi:MAG: hypothetical protein JO256_02320 [Alphaproteobacteria bacterium]|nr:hypothetical protein [Alphaproteobacteria bacterium]